MFRHWSEKTYRICSPNRLIVRRNHPYAASIAKMGEPGFCDTAARPKRTEQVDPTNQQNITLLQLTVYHVFSAMKMLNLRSASNASKRIVSHHRLQHCNQLTVQINYSRVTFHWVVPD